MGAMDMDFRPSGAHILAVPYPTQGHVNPMLQFCKRLVAKGAKATLAVTKFIAKSRKPKSGTVVIATISDGCDDGFREGYDVGDYLSRMEIEGSRTLEELIRLKAQSDEAVDCVVYDAFCPWALEVAKKCGVKGAAFFTQACGVSYVYYNVKVGLLGVPVAAEPVEIQGLPPLHVRDLPSFISVHGSYPAYFELVLNQFSNVEKADFVLVNSFYKLEERVVEEMKQICPILTIGPTIPSFYLDKRVEDDDEYGINLFEPDSAFSLHWLNSKPRGSVVYVAFGSLSGLQSHQLREIALGLKMSSFHFIWTIKAADQESLPADFITETIDKALFISWSPQLLAQGQ